jgi:hypothetical protein
MPTVRPQSCVVGLGFGHDDGRSASGGRAARADRLLDDHRRWREWLQIHRRMHLFHDCDPRPSRGNIGTPIGRNKLQVFGTFML